MKRTFFVCLMMVMLICGCSSNNTNNDLISYIDAKEMIINDGAILIDVRTEDEYNDEHISGAVLLDVNNINEDNAKNVIHTFDTEVIVYCTSGNRSSQAKVLLEGLGYTKVYDLGAMSNWEE